MKTRFMLSALVFALASPRIALSQGQAAVPFLLIHSWPEGNGWGNVAAAVVSDNPINTMSNPAHLGLFSLRGNVSASLYVPKTNWLPTLGVPDMTYHVWAMNAA
ncbi:MAG: hypothetical protein C4326_13005 [Ignavibacteria bacterium]